MKESFLLPHLAKVSQLSNWPKASVPAFAQVNDYIPWLCKVPCDYLLRDDPAGMAECSLLVQEYLDLDLITANLDVYNFEAEAIGAPIHYYKDHMPDLDRSNYLIKSEADFDKVCWKGLESGRFPYLISYAKAYAEYTGIPGTLVFSGPWTLAGNLYGLDNLILAAIEDPDFVHELLRRIVEDLHEPMFRELRKLFPFMNQIFFVDAFVSPPMSSMPIIREFIEPSLHHEMEMLESLGIKNMIFNDAGIWGVTHVRKEDRDEFIDFTARMGAGIVTAYDPDAYDLGIRFFREYADRNKAPLMIGLSTSFLRNASPEEVAERVKDYVLTGRDGITPMQFFFSNIAPETPIENIAAAIAAVHTYGAPGADKNTSLVIPDKEPFEDFLKKKIKNNVEGYTFHWLEMSKYSGLLHS